MRACRDCHYHQEWNGVHQCSHDSARIPHYNYITGETTYQYRSCEDNRSCMNTLVDISIVPKYCSHDGIFWKQKEAAIVD